MEPYSAARACGSPTLEILIHKTLDESSLLAVHGDLVSRWMVRDDASFPHSRSLSRQSNEKACGFVSEMDFHARVHHEGQAVVFSSAILDPFLTQEADRREVGPAAATSGQYHRRL